MVQGARPIASANGLRPDVSVGDDSPRHEAECDADEKTELRLHKFLLLRFQPVWAACGRSGFLVKRWLPAPHVLHPYPDARFAAIHPR